VNIALYHTNLPDETRKPGGVEVVVHRLANALVEFKHVEVTVFSCDSKPSGSLYKHVQLFDGRWQTGLSRWTILSTALNFVDFASFDVLHLHGDDWFFTKRSIPTVRSMHGSALQEARYASGAKRRLSQYALYPLEHLSSRLATVAMAVGSETQSIYHLSAVIDNGVDLIRFRQKPKSEVPLIAFIGSWEGRKRGHMFFDVFLREVLPAFPSAQLYMASDVAPKHPNVINACRPSDAELAEWLGKAWVFASASSYEGFGIPYIEAMACGTAIVTTRNSGAEYVLASGAYGVMTSDFLFGTAINELLASAQRRQALEVAGVEYVKRFSWERVADRHLEIYRAAIAKSQHIRDEPYAP
jgi:glycosyltransferase involved in cell wall biosynthesis